MMPTLRSSLLLLLTTLPLLASHAAESLPASTESAESSAADVSVAADEGEGMTAEAFVASLDARGGEITLPGSFAKITLPENFVYINSQNAERLLTEGWGNPSGAGTLGMILPADVSPVSEQGWGIVLTYDNDGYVSDEDANEIDYDDLLTDMKDATAESNEAREQAGYGRIDLVGWAVPPSYDSNQHKMVWAQELKFSEAETNTLNYNIRVLGREGVLVLNAVSAMDQLQMIRMETPALVAATEFLPGKRYEDFNPSTDKVAEYGLATLVAGGVAAKLGLFGKIGAFLMVFKKFIFIGVIALGALLMKLFRRKET